MIHRELCLSSAAKEYLKVYGVLVGKKPLVFTNNDSGYETAIEFKKNGIRSSYFRLLEKILIQK